MSTLEALPTPTRRDSRRTVRSQRGMPSSSGLPQTRRILLRSDAVMRSVSSSHLATCRPNTADQLRSGAPVRLAGGGTGRHLSLQYGCRPELRQLHPLVRRPRSTPCALVDRRARDATARQAAAYSHGRSQYRTELGSSRRSQKPSPIDARPASTRRVPQHRRASDSSTRTASSDRERHAPERCSAAMTHDGDSRLTDCPSGRSAASLARATADAPRARCSRRDRQPQDCRDSAIAVDAAPDRVTSASEPAGRSGRCSSRSSPPVRRTPRISCEAVPPSDLAGGGTGRHLSLAVRVPP